MLKKISPELSDEVQRVLREHGDGERLLPLRLASERSGIATSQIHNMSQGQIIGCEFVMKFASAFGEDIGDWLRLCGYDEIAALVTGKPAVKVAVENEFDELLKQVPAKRRPKARRAAIHAIETLIVPLYTDAIAA